MTTRDVLEKIMRGKKSAKQAFEDFCKQEGVSGIVIFTTNQPVILLKDEFVRKLKTGGAKGNGLVLTTDNMQFYKGYDSIEYSIMSGVKLLQAKYGIIIENGSKWYGSDAEASYSLVESVCDYVNQQKTSEPAKVEIVNTIDNPVNVNITNEDEDVTEESYEDEDYFSDEDDDD